MTLGEAREVESEKCDSCSRTEMSCELLQTKLALAIQTEARKP